MDEFPPQFALEPLFENFRSNLSSEEGGDSPFADFCDPFNVQAQTLAELLEVEMMLMEESSSVTQMSVQNPSFEDSFTPLDSGLPRAEAKLWSLPQSQLLSPASSKATLQQHDDRFPPLLNFGLFGGSSNCFSSSLSVPCAFGNSLCAFGTQEWGDRLKSLNKIVVCEFPAQRNLKLPLATFVGNIGEAVTSLCFIDEQNLVFALSGGRMGCLSLWKRSFSDREDEMVSLSPAFHTDDVRDIAVSADKSLILSGSHDGFVFVSDVSRMASSTLTENRRCVVGSSVSGVSFCPADRNVVSISVDSGAMYIADVRAKLNHLTPIIMPNVHGDAFLYDHVWTGENSVVLGFSNAVLVTCDVRAPGKQLSCVEDVMLSELENLDFCWSSKTLASFGTGGCSFWNVQGGAPFVASVHQPSSVSSRQVGGAFFSGGSSITTSSDGCIAQVLS